MPEFFSSAAGKLGVISSAIRVVQCAVISIVVDALKMPVIDLQKSFLVAL
jgi:hypothetical protein